MSFHVFLCVFILVCLTCSKHGFLVAHTTSIYKMLVVQCKMPNIAGGEAAPIQPQQIVCGKSKIIQTQLQRKWSASTDFILQ